MLFLALRHLISRRQQTLLTLMGIVIGTAAYIAISGMMLGFQEFMVDQLVNNDSHVRIKAREELLTKHSLDDAFFPSVDLINWQKSPSGRKDNPYILAPGLWLQRLNQDERVSAASPQLVAQGIVTYGKLAFGVQIIGSDPERQTQVTNIESFMTHGRYSDIGVSGNRIAIGDGLLKKLGASVGETVFLTVGKGAPLPFRIVSVFHLGIKGLDESRVFASLSDVQRLNQTPSRISDIAVRLVNLDQAQEIVSTLNLVGQEKVESWDQANEGILSVFVTQDIVRILMTVSILIVAGFGIYNILSLAVNHKRREIAILRSIGFEPSDIHKLFLLQGLLLGLTGGIFGAILGWVSCLAMSWIQVSPDRGLGSGYMLVSFEGGIYIKAFLMALISSSLASYFPARLAGGLEPIDIIRGENN